MNDGEALYNAIAANPEEDAPRAAWLDWLTENEHAPACRARAEFVRVQCELAALLPPDDGDVEFRRYSCERCWVVSDTELFPQVPGRCPHCGHDRMRKTRVNDTGANRRAELVKREHELRAANEATWRRGPLCERCGGDRRIEQHHDPASDTWRGGRTCPDCDGTGDAGGLMRRDGRDEPHPTKPDPWRHPVAFLRGHIDAASCTLAEVVHRPLYNPGHDTEAHGPWQVTDWARRVCRYHPVTRFVVTDRVPFQCHQSLIRNNGQYFFQCYDRDGRQVSAPYRVTEAVIEEMELIGTHVHKDDCGEEGVGVNLYYPTAELANDALARALARLARLARGAR